MTANSENVLPGAHPSEERVDALARELGRSTSRPRSLGDWLRRVSVNDWIVLAYLGLLDFAILAAPQHGAARDRALGEMSALLLGFFLVVVVLIRGGLLNH